MTALSLKNVNKSFGPVHVLKDINLEVEDGEFVDAAMPKIPKGGGAVGIEFGANAQGLEAGVGMHGAVNAAGDFDAIAKEPDGAAIGDKGDMLPTAEGKGFRLGHVKRFFSRGFTTVGDFDIQLSRAIQ